MLTMFGAFIFSAYIIYDTQMIMKHLSAEEYVIGVINLYMDIINLFVKILKLLNTLKEQGEKREKNKRK
jgi:FtsH-binding integral membrane protein